MNTVLIIALCVAGAILLAFLVFYLVFRIRIRHFRPNPNKAAQQQELNKDLQAAGFAYDRHTDCFYSLMNCWQREMGYCRLYDEAAPNFNMIMDCEPVTFSYGGKRWLIEFWKGQYGITTGAEVGIYNTGLDDIHSDRFTGTFYQKISDAEMLPMAFVLRRNGKVIMRRKGIHWWLTGFRLGKFSQPGALTMDIKITFPNREMCLAFAGALTDIGYRRGEFSTRFHTVIVHYTTPHTKQPDSRNIVKESVIQQVNENNCRLYRVATNQYTDTLDKLEYIRAAVPELYEFFTRSLYARGLFKAFEWLADLILPKPHPTPPVPPAPPIPPTPPMPPCPPRPCPPKPCECVEQPSGWERCRRNCSEDQ